MPRQTGQPWFEVEHLGDVTVVRFRATCRRFLEDETIRALSDRLFRLVQEEGRRNLVLNLDRVERLDSLLLGKIVGLHKKTLAAGGRLVLCHLNPDLQEIFQTLQLTGFLWIYSDEQEALQSF